MRAQKTKDGKLRVKVKKDDSWASNNFLSEKNKKEGNEKNNDKYIKDLHAKTAASRFGNALRESGTQVKLKQVSDRKLVRED